MLECLFPVGDDLAFDQPARLLAFVGGATSFFLALSGPFVFDVADPEPQQLDDGEVVGEPAAVLDDLAQLVVRSDSIELVVQHDLAQLWGERQGTG